MFWILQFVRKNFEANEVQVLPFFPSYWLRSIFFFLSLLVVTQIRGHISTSSSPPDGGRILDILILCYKGKTQIVQTNRNLSGRNTGQNGQQHEKWSEAAPEIVAYSWHCTRWMKCERLQLFSSVVVMMTAAVLHACADGPQFRTVSAISPAKHITRQMPTPWAHSLHHDTNAYYPVGSFVQCLREVLSVVFSHVKCSFCETSKTRNNKAENGPIFGREKHETPTWNVVLKHAKKYIWVWKNTLSLGAWMAFY